MKVNSPLDAAIRATLSAGEPVELSGTVYTARDQAHRRLIELITAGKPLPVDLTGQTIYYAGPAPPPPGRIIGSIGPTTSARMDAFTPTLLAAGIGLAMIGKGSRSPEVYKAIQQHGAVYLTATGGAAAYLAQFVTACEVVAYPELGPEAIYRLEVNDLPLFVCVGGDGSRGLVCR